MKLIMVAFSMLMLVLTVPAWAVTRYVATTGLDSRSCAESATITTPRQTIAAAIGCMASGDTLIIRGGTYTNQFVSNVPSGGGEATRSVVKGAAGETVTLLVPAGGAGVDIDTQSYITVENMILDGQAKAADVGLSLGGNLGQEHHINIKDVEVRWFKVNGASVFNEEPSGLTRGHHKFINVHVHDNGSCCLGVDTHGFYVTSEDSLWDNVTVHDQTQGFLMHVYRPGGDFSGNIIRNSRFYNGASTILFSRDTIIENNIFGPSAVAWGGGLNFTYGGSGNIVRNNTIVNNTGSNGGGISLTDTGAPVSIINNLVYGNSHSGIVIYSGATPVIQNNLASNNAGGVNCRDDRGQGGCTSAGQTGNLFGSFDPLFVNAGASDFHLLSGSPAIDSGQTIAALTTDKDGVARPQGSAYDIGAYEFGSAPPVNQLISSWPATEGSGTTVNDTEPQDNNGSLVNGVSWLTTPTRLSFAAASSQYMSVPQNLMTWLGGTFSIVFDMGTTQVGSSANWWQNPGIVGLETVGDANDIAVVVGNDGKLWVARGATTIKTAVAINDGTERCLAVTVNSSTGAIQIFRANVVDGSGTLETGARTGSLTALGRLTVSNGAHIYYTGTLRRVKLYNYVISTADVANVCGATPTFDFTVAAAGNKTMSQGGTVDSVITVQLIAGTAEAVTPSVLSGLPSGVSAAFAPTTCTPSGGSCTSTMTLTATAGATTGTTAVIVRGTAGSVIRDAPSFNLTVNPTVVGVTFTQGKARIGTAELSPLRWQRPPNTNGTIIPGGRVAVPIQVGGAGGDPPANIFDLWASKNAGAYALVPDACAATGVCLVSGALVHGTVISGRILPQVESTFVPGTVVGRAPTTSIDLSNGSETNLLFYVGVGADVIPGTDTFRLRIHRRTGQAMETYSAGADVLLSVVKPGRFIVSGPAFSAE